MSVLMSWLLHAARQCKRAGGVLPGSWFDRGSKMSLRLLFFQIRLIMANDIQVFWWWGGKTDGLNSSHVSLISSGNQYKSSDNQDNIQRKQSRIQTKEVEMNFVYNLSLQAKV